MTTMSEAKSVRRRQTKIGVVASDKADKSVVVRVDRIVKHERYERYVRRSTRYLAHDEANGCRIGDTVEITESRPLSASKRWRVSRILKRAATVEAAPESAE